VEYVSLLHPIVAIMPAYFRFAQCIRRYRDTKESFPHLVNAAKYATSFFVVIFAHKYHTTTGKWIHYTKHEFIRAHRNCKYIYMYTYIHYVCYLRSSAN